tara:strand:- start:13601 stop:14677 length:1077 start_codon:yes stop_codon:yes gene_type:complete
MIRILDLLIARTFLRIFALFIIGAPLLFIIGNIIENVDSYFERGLTAKEVAWAYVYQLPEYISWSFPIAALIAAVFTIHSMTQNREVMAAKAGGISFHRLMVPLIAMGIVLAGASLILNNAVPIAKRRAGQILRSEDPSKSWRADFVFKADDDRTIMIRRLNVYPAGMNNVVMEVPKKLSPEQPAEHISAKEVSFDTTKGWTFKDGYLRILPDDRPDLTFYFDSLRARGFSEYPVDLLEQPNDEDEMTVAEIDRMAANISRSGGNPSELLVKREQRKAIAVATLVIILFGGPLATSSRRGGTAYGIGLALGSTILYLLIFRLSGAAGQTGVIPPLLSAWLPNIIFLVCGLTLLKRVRT